MLFFAYIHDICILYILTYYFSNFVPLHVLLLGRVPHSFYGSASGFPTRILHAFVISPMYTTCPAHLIFLDLIILISLVKSTQYGAPYYAISGPDILLTTQLSNILIINCNSSHVLIWCEVFSPLLREEDRLKVSGNKCWEEYLGLTVELMGELRRLYTEEDNYFNLPS
jgi:hypothetical protein